NGIGRLPVITIESGKLVGIITRTDIIRAYERSLDLLSKSDPT
ncbi:MAG: CBS domain-containing protein, partial [Nitrososphaerota archaeon]|nr:CBS domain-containing protein [Nitrososphaerota archaeon]